MLFRPIQLGPVAIDFPVALAALSGYSDWPARVIARRLGAGYTFGEVLLDQFVLNVTKGRKATRFIRITDDDHPAAAQLMGGDSDALVPAALKLVEAGFDWIDINFGCPVRKVLGRCRGGYLLGHPAVALELIGRVRDALPPGVPLTVKMRRGTDDSPLARDNFYAIFDGAFDRGAAAVTLHPRTVRQRYEGPSRWGFLAEAKRHAGDRIVVGSGDLFTAADCLAMVRQTGVDGVTIARGAIGNPWIFRQLLALAAGLPLPEPPGLAEQREVIAEHFRLAAEVYGPERAGSMMRKVCIKYAQLHPQHEQVRAAFVKVKGRRQWEQLLARWYTDSPSGDVHERL